MCGIFGFLGREPGLPFGLKGIRRIESRGYDSAGTALVDSTGMVILKVVAEKNQSIDTLTRRVSGEEAERGRPFGQPLCVIHTRWATHGDPTPANAHPHADCTGRIAVVHNGIIENFATLKAALIKRGHRFVSETDTEVVPHLIEEGKASGLSFEESVRWTVKQLTGAFALAIVDADSPGVLIGVRDQSPLLYGYHKETGRWFIASQVSAFSQWTMGKYVVLKDGEMVVIANDTAQVSDYDNHHVDSVVEQDENWEVDPADKGEFAHFMLKEIFEQPESVRNASRGRLVPSDGTARLGGLRLSDDQLRQVTRIITLACGTSDNAGRFARYAIQDLARVPVDTEVASEFAKTNPIVDPLAMYLAISQSGETKDTLAALGEAKRRGGRVFGIVNDPTHTTIARECGRGTYIHAGPEIGVASTKAFTGQATILLLLGLLHGRLRGLSLERGREIAAAIESLPDLIRQTLELAPMIEGIAVEYGGEKNFLYLGSGPNYPIAMEGALKLKEIAYVHAEGYPAAEMKHGPLALISPKQEPGEQRTDVHMTTVVVCPRIGVSDDALHSIEEIRGRGGSIIVVATAGDEEVQRKVDAGKIDHVIAIPPAHPLVAPLVAVVPLQLFAYYSAVLRGCNPDRPRNLAKAVTVK